MRCSAATAASIDFTVGQRKGLGIALAEPMYVLELRPSDKTVVVGPRPELEQTTLTASQVNWIAGIAADGAAARHGSDSPSPSAGAGQRARARRRPCGARVRHAANCHHARPGRGVLRRETWCWAGVGLIED